MIPDMFMFRYQEDGSKKLNTYSLFFLRIVYFNLNTESHYLQIIYDSIHTLDNTCSSSTPCSLLPLYLTYLENQLSCSWCEYPSTLVPGLLTTARPLLVLLPFHTPQINSYIDDINNISHPRLTQIIYINCQC